MGAGEMGGMGGRGTRELTDARAAGIPLAGNDEQSVIIFLLIIIMGLIIRVAGNSLAGNVIVCIARSQAMPAQCVAI